MAADLSTKEMRCDIVICGIGRVIPSVAFGEEFLCYLFAAYEVLMRACDLLMQRPRLHEKILSEGPRTEVYQKPK